jgi:hypothetical protein
MDIAWIGLFSAADWPAPLGAKLETTSFFHRVIETVDRPAGRLIAVPVYMDADILYYRFLIRSENETYSVDQTVILSFQSDRIHLFEPEADNHKFKRLRHKGYP